VKPTRAELLFSTNQPQVPWQFQHSPFTSVRPLMKSWKWKNTCTRNNCKSVREKNAGLLSCSQSSRPSFIILPLRQGYISFHCHPLHTHCQGLHSGMPLVPSSAASPLMLISQLFLTSQPGNLSLKTAGSSTTSSLLLCSVLQVLPFFHSSPVSPLTFLTLLLFKSTYFKAQNLPNEHKQSREPKLVALFWK